MPSVRSLVRVGALAALPFGLPPPAPAAASSAHTAPLHVAPQALPHHYRPTGRIRLPGATHALHRLPPPVGARGTPAPVSPPDHRPFRRAVGPDAHRRGLRRAQRRLVSRCGRRDGCLRGLELRRLRLPHDHPAPPRLPVLVRAPV